MSFNILLLVGSGRQKSHTLALGQAIERALQAKRATVTLVELATADLPFADPAYHRDPIQNPDVKVQQLVRQAAEADAIVLLSPIYHNSYSSRLKNALDHLAIAQFAGKTVGLASHGGNRTTQAVDHLRIVARGLNATAIPTQVCTQDSDYAEADQGFMLSDAGILERVERFAEELVRLGAALNSVRGA